MTSRSTYVQNADKEPLYTPVYNRDEPGIVHGLTAFTAAVFIVGEMAGSGVLALPNAVVNAGWIGIVLICLLGMLSGICGIALGKSWLILRRDFTEYQGQVRYPYPALGFHSYGRLGKYAVVICINATLIGKSIIYTCSKLSHCVIVYFGKLNRNDAVSPPLSVKYRRQ